jgi:transcriptional regulator with XRE-family HTH domain
MAGRPPEAKLIYERRKELGLSFREAARRAGKGVSEGSWRRTEGERRLTRTARTVARMAQVVGITPAELLSAGRADAARILTGLPPLEIPPQSADEEIRELKVQLKEVIADVAALKAGRDDEDPEGYVRKVRR